MAIFYVMFFVVALFSHMEVNVGLKENSKKKVFLLIFFFFYLLSFLRWEYGADWDGYYIHFEAYTWDNAGDHELLYTSILLLAKNIIDDYTFVLFCFSSIIFYFQIKGIYKLSSLPLTSLLVFTGTYFCNVGYSRQCLALAILFYSLLFILQRKLLPFLVSIFVAFGFHYSALVFLPAYWIYHLNISRKQLIVFIVLSIILSSLMTFFLQGIGDLLGVAGIIDRIDKYTDQGYDYEDGSSLDPRQTIVKACINRGIYLVIGLYLVGKSRDYNRYFSGLFNLYCFGTILFFMTSPIHITLTRMSWYYDFFQILFIPGIFLYVNKTKRRVIFLMLSALMFLKLYMNVNFTSDVYAVYKFIPSIEKFLN